MEGKWPAGRDHPGTGPAVHRGAGPVDAEAEAPELIAPDLLPLAWGHEPAWCAVRKGSTARWCGDRTQSTVWDIARKDDTGETNHGTQKPVECMERPMRNHGEPGEAVYDPFLGSGSTLIAAERSQRRCFGMELEPRYCDVIVERWEMFTGGKAERG